MSNVKLNPPRGSRGLVNLCVEKVYVLDDVLYHYYVNRNSTVISKDAEHHLDLLTVQILLGKELEKRNLMEKYRSEIEFEILLSCILHS